MIQQASLPRRHTSSVLCRRMRRGRLNARRLEYEASVLASVHGAVRLGSDLELAGLLLEAGLGDDAISALRFREAGSEYSLILPTNRTWNQARLQVRVFDVGVRATTAGRRVLIVPPAEVTLQPRLRNTRRIFHTKTVAACGDAETLTAFIDARGGEAALVECEAALAGPQPRRRVFGLVYGGHFAMNLEVEITNLSIVRLRHPQPNWGWDALGWQPIRAL